MKFKNEVAERLKNVRNSPLKQECFKTRVLATNRYSAVQYTVEALNALIACVTVADSRIDFTILILS